MLCDSVNCILRASIEINGVYLCDEHFNFIQEGGKLKTMLGMLTLNLDNEPVLIV